jgi:hypothetical protein
VYPIGFYENSPHFYDQMLSHSFWENPSSLERREGKAESECEPGNPEITAQNTIVGAKPYTDFKEAIDSLLGVQR